MRRLAVLALVVPLLAAGCGGSDDASGPLDEGLRHLPRDTPFAVAIETDLEGRQYRAAQALANRFPFADQAEDALKDMFERGGVDFDRDVKPLLGNPFVVGAGDAKRFDSESYVGVLEVEDGDKLNDLVERTKADEKGEKEGAKLYEDSSGGVFAIEDDVLVVAGTRKLLEDALERRGGDDTLTEETFEAALEGLPQESLGRVYVNGEALLEATADGRRAARIKWLDAVQTLGLVAQARRDSVVLPFRLKTDPERLSKEDLPFATGNASPSVVQRDGEAGVGIRDPGQIVRFALDAAVAYQGPAVELALRQLEGQLNIDIDRDVVDQLRGDTSVVVTPAGRWGIRAELRDPAEFERTLAKVAPALPRVLQGLGGGRASLSRDGDLYELTLSTGRVVFGVSRGVLVIARDRDAASSLAGARPTSVGGAKGSVAVGADAEAFADEILDDFSGLGLLGGLFGVTEPVGDLTGSMTTSTSGMRGTLELKID
jgi:Protein of unknown function (DUF3352)